MHENRETSRAPGPERERGRSAKAQSHKADAHALEESDRAILSMNQTNKEERSSAEPGERRARTKENIVQPNTNPTQSGERVPGIERCARSSKEKEARTVHGFAPPCERGSTPGQLLRLKAASSTGSRWRDVEGV
jgi:hypothetical protein